MNRSGNRFDSDDKVRDGSHMSIQSRNNSSNLKTNRMPSVSSIQEMIDNSREMGTNRINI